MVMAESPLPAALERRIAQLVDHPDAPHEGELWDMERLAQHGRQLAEHSDRPGPSSRVSIQRELKANSRALHSAYNCIVAALRAGRAVTPAAQWIIDNFHVVADQLVDSPVRLTPKVWQRLPRATHPDAQGWPRIHHIATEYLRHTLWEFKPDSLARMLSGYQDVTTLTMRELWALYPILQVALISELRRVAQRVEDSLAARAAADKLADALVSREWSEEDAGPHSAAWADSRFAAPFIVQLAHRLQGMGERGAPFLGSLSRQLARHGTTIDDYIQRQHARRSATNVAARNIITSLRALGSFDWRTLFEKTSGVEALLRGQRDYLASDLRTRDRYRSSIEDLARTVGRDELGVTQQIIALVEGTPTGAAAATLGSWLIGRNRPKLESALRFRTPPGTALRRWTVHHAHGLYLGGIATLTAVLTAIALYHGVDRRTAAPLTIAVLALLAVVPLSEFAIGVLNRFWLRAFPPRHLPSLALESGLQQDMRTLVVVPTMLRSAQEALAACRQLQVHALANPDPCISYALLSDWGDSPTENAPYDAVILETARGEIAALNRTLATEGSEPRFYVLHRRRVWHETEGCFTGWERKRGKLAELNRLLLQRGTTTFIPDDDGVVHAPENIRYVVTVDADTRVPLGSVRDLVGTAAHPLNAPVISREHRRVVQGYGVLQPRITPLLPETGERSLYREIVTSGSGIDPYAAAVSDLHQDVFGEGLFTGKGLYDLHAWETVMQGRVPPNSLLSHDLFEGIFARCGLVSDLELFEDFPSHSEVAAMRSHRWMRGDWQLLPWILGRRGPLPPLGRWKMIDNLRRSLLAPSAVALLIAAFASVNAHPLWWLGVVVAPLVWPALATAVDRLFRTPQSRSRRMHIGVIGADLGADLGRAAVSMAMLAQNAWLSIDAIGRALFRLTISRRRLLEWTTAAHSKAGRSGALTSFVWPLKSASIVVVGAVAVLMATNPSAALQCAPLLLLWWLSPVLAQFLSRPLDVAKPEDEIPASVDVELRSAARLTWTFFETHVTEEDNCLPPDNFQEDPEPVLAHRSSPTNVGLYLLAVCAARDFGWLGLKDMCSRLEATLTSLRKLQRFEGHFLNWYDTRTLQPLLPQYVSTVDSGNLAGHLLTLRQACIEARTAPLLSPRALQGPLDSLSLCRREVQRVGAADAGAAARLTSIDRALAQLEKLLQSEPSTVTAARDTLHRVAQALATLRNPTLPRSVLRWLDHVERDVESQRRDLRLILLEDDPEQAGEGDHADLSPSRSVSLSELAITSAPCATLSHALADIADQCQALVAAMSFSFLYDRSRGLFSIGYRVADRALDEGYYDLLASEARLASLVAIAKGDVPRSHWFRLGRRLTGGSRQPVLASWSGSMFEYLMPTLVMQEPRQSLLEQTNRRVVRQQIRYGDQHQLPWGISESAYNVRDREYTYQYSGFGVPSLGLKRGLAADYVIAPYATMLAAMYDPVSANQNLRELAQHGGRGEYGFYEALDFTAPRVPEGSTVAVVRAYMAHHQGMSLLALDNVLHDGAMQRRFHSEPRIAAADLLLQERSLRFVDAPVLAVAEVPPSPALDEAPDVARFVEGYTSPTPVTHLLSNRHYSVMLTDSGAGSSSWRGRAVTRWREDSTRDCWGSFIYLRDLEQDELWSAGFQPTAAPADDYRVQFNEECAVFWRRKGGLGTTMAVVVAPDDDGELRQITLHNDGSRARRIELTSYAEIVLAPLRADIAHPGFSNLFVQTEFASDSGALLATRRPRSDREAPIWAVHVIASSGTAPSHLQYETDRGRFLGRGRDNRRPLALEPNQALSNTVGNVLDPVFSLRTQVTLPPRSKVSITFATFVASSREQAASLIAKYRTPNLFEHVVGSAWTFVRAELYYLRSTLSEARLFQSLAGHLVQSTPQLRATRDPAAPNVLDVAHLWRFSISGDRPILLIRVHTMDDLPFIHQCLRAQEYLRMKNLVVDVVVLNERRHSYVQDLQHAIENSARVFANQSREGGEVGGIYTLAGDTVGEAERRLLLALARAVLDPAQGGLMEQLSRPSLTHQPDAPSPARALPATPLPLAGDAGRAEFFNGWGGFVAEGREYAITLSGTAVPPAPWSNVLANEQFGTLVTERGSMCTWSLNSRENQLTPWSNDPVTDPSGERIYLRDEDGALWSPMPQPVRRGDARYDIRHGQGYSTFDTQLQGIATRCTVLVAAEDAVKVVRLKLTNRAAVARQITVVTCVDWCIGAQRGAVNHDVQTRLDPLTGAQFACNPALMDFGGRVAFCDLGGRQQYGTDSRHQFLGRNGSFDAPIGIASMTQWSMVNAPGRDPCCAFAVVIELAPGATDEVLLLLGQEANADLARASILKYRSLGAEGALQAVQARWDRLLGAVQIRTPDRALDLLFNRWMLYQAMSCRLWGRTGFYQSGGAFGFRDQLQDGMAITLSAPGQVRAHLLRAAARQYIEGDVQHWWHPPSGRGVRTHFSDDRVWLPMAVEHYIESTGDAAVLEEVLPFIEGPPLPIEQEDSHYVPGVSNEQASLYEHCARALDRSLVTGAHGLPLMGGGDWNDGMNRVGHAGRGESVWMAWFLIYVFDRFLPIARRRRDTSRVESWSNHRESLVRACEQQAWDGDWYCRAFFDDGTPLGSSGNTECRIDSLSQSWAVISRAADPERALTGMEAVERQLIQLDQGLVLLFAPPFDSAPVDPGYIKGYLPGLRENGGQYTHAAVWVLMAEALLGRNRQVADLLGALNPVRRSATPEDARTYRVEPYVIAADIYAGSGIAQRGGWTWYTGAAGWMHRVVLEQVLGIRVTHTELHIAPCVPSAWPEFEVQLRLDGADYRVRMKRAAVRGARLLLDGASVAGSAVPVLRDQRPHVVEIELPRTQ